MKSVDLTAELLRSVDCTVILTDHSSVDYGHVARFSPFIVDTRNALQGHSRSEVVAL
jgi:UDP-N-acetyl-D-glucosamine dehydrogenase